ncbi:MAG: hypothetical protein ACE5I3_06075, partial [Phycisphaerae bacterium]
YMAGRILFGPVKEPAGAPDLSTGLRPDLTRREIAILAPLAAAVVVLGVAPRLITDTLDPALETQVMTRIAAATGTNAEAAIADSHGENVGRWESGNGLVGVTTACAASPVDVPTFPRFHLPTFPPSHVPTPLAAGAAGGP